MGVKLHIFGCLSGTEPMPGMHHTAWAIEYDGGLYWFDAGENGHRTAHLMGLDLLSIRTIAISHPHIDHCGGLLNLLCAMRKLQWLKDRVEDFDVRMMLPEVKMWDCAREFLELMHEHHNFTVMPSQIVDGKIFDDGKVSIEARHNYHIQSPGADKYDSFSFRIKVDGKTIVASGDVRSYADMGDWLDECDLLLMETGHHKASEVCAALRRENRGVKDIIFIHHGRELLNDHDNALARAEKAWGAPLRVASDGSTFEL